MLDEVPIDIRLNLGTDAFAAEIKDYYQTKCQHAISHTVKTCTQCVKESLFNEQHLLRNQKVYESNLAAYQDGLYFNMKTRKEITWTSMFLHGLYSQKHRLQKLSITLRQLRKSRIVMWNPAVKNY